MSNPFTKLESSNFKVIADGYTVLTKTQLMRDIASVARQHDKQFDRHLTAGFFLVDLMTAMTLLALVSIVGLRVMQLSETTFTEGRIQLSIQQKIRRSGPLSNIISKMKRLAKPARRLFTVTQPCGVICRANTG